jgi:hypothetical protein
MRNKHIVRLQCGAVFGVIEYSETELQVGGPAKYREDIEKLFDGCVVKKKWQWVGTASRMRSKVRLRADMSFEMVCTLRQNALESVESVRSLRRLLS